MKCWLKFERFYSRKKNQSCNCQSKAAMCQPFYSAAREADDKDHKLILESFQLADVGNNGYLTKSEFKIGYLAVFGCKPSKFEVNEVLQKRGNFFPPITENCQKIPVIDLETFKDIVYQRLRYSDIDDDIKETFQILDTRCKGFLDFDDFHKLIMKFLPNFDPLRMRKIFNEADRDNDGRVSFRDFQLLMKHDFITM